MEGMRRQSLIEEVKGRRLTALEFAVYTFRESMEIVEELEGDRTEDTKHLRVAARIVAALAMGAAPEDVIQTEEEEAAALKVLVPELTARRGPIDYEVKEQPRSTTDQYPRRVLLICERRGKGTKYVLLEEPQKEVLRVLEAAHGTFLDLNEGPEAPALFDFLEKRSRRVKKLEETPQLGDIDRVFTVGFTG